MEKSVTRDRVIAEIDLIPEHHLSELYSLIHNFKCRVEIDPNAKKRIMQFAGSWADLPEDEFRSFMTEVRQRRRQAFTGRRSHEARPD